MITNANVIANGNANTNAMANVNANADVNAVLVAQPYVSGQNKVWSA